MRAWAFAIALVLVIAAGASAFVGSAASLGDQLTRPSPIYTPFSGASVSLAFDTTCHFGACSSYGSLIPSSLSGTTDAAGTAAFAPANSYTTGSGSAWWICWYNDLNGANDLALHPVTFWPSLSVTVNGQDWGSTGAMGYEITGCPTTSDVSGGAYQPPPSLPSSPSWPASRTFTAPTSYGIASTGAPEYYQITINFSPPSGATTTTTSTTLTSMTTTITTGGTTSVITYASPPPPPAPLAPQNLLPVGLLFGALVFAGVGFTGKGKSKK